MREAALVCPSSIWRWSQRPISQNTMVVPNHAPVGHAIEDIAHQQEPCVLEHGRLLEEWQVVDDENDYKEQQEAIGIDNHQL